jgi:hypothetical protein
MARLNIAKSRLCSVLYDIEPVLLDTVRGRLVLGDRMTVPHSLVYELAEFDRRALKRPMTVLPTRARHQPDSPTGHDP